MTEELVGKDTSFFLDEFLVSLVEELDRLAMHTHCQDKISSFSNAVTYNMYDSTIKGKFDSTGATLLSMCGFLSIHTNVFLVVNQPDKKHDEEIETPDEEKENLFSFFLIEFHDSFLNEKHTHGRFPQQKSSATKLLDGLCRGKRSCVRGLIVQPYYKPHTMRRYSLYRPNLQMGYTCCI